MIARPSRPDDAGLAQRAEGTEGSCVERDVGARELRQDWKRAGRRGVERIVDDRAPVGAGGRPRGLGPSRVVHPRQALRIREDEVDLLLRLVIAEFDAGKIVDPNDLLEGSASRRLDPDILQIAARRRQTPRRGPDEWCEIVRRGAVYQHFEPQLTRRGQNGRVACDRGQLRSGGSQLKAQRENSGDKATSATRTHGSAHDR